MLLYTMKNRGQKLASYSHKFYSQSALGMALLYSASSFKRDFPVEDAQQQAGVKSHRRRSSAQLQQAVPIARSGRACKLVWRRPILDAHAHVGVTLLVLVVQHWKPCPRNVIDVQHVIKIYQARLSPSFLHGIIIARRGGVPGSRLCMSGQSLLVESVDSLLNVRLMIMSVFVAYILQREVGKSVPHPDRPPKGLFT